MKVKKVTKFNEGTVFSYTLYVFIIQNIFNIVTFNKNMLTDLFYFLIIKVISLWVITNKCDFTNLNGM